VSGAFYADLNFTAKIKVGEADGQIFLNITNLFDRDPILLPEGGLSANSTFSDLLGRSFRIGVRFRTN
jgi:outer membrane receptor protein involved in Fe transport